MIIASLRNLINSISNKLLIAVLSCTLYLLYSVILFMLFNTKNKLNEDKFIN